MPSIVVITTFAIENPVLKKKIDNFSVRPEYKTFKAETPVLWPPHAKG